MLFSPFLARRYLKPKRTFVSIITVISIIGVALGVWLLAVVIAVFTGYGERIKESIFGFEPHLVIDSGKSLSGWLEVCEKISAFEGVVSVTPFVRGQVVMDFNRKRIAPTVRGILPPEGEELDLMRAKLATAPALKSATDPTKASPQGDFDLQDLSSAVLGVGIADGMNARVGDKIMLHSQADIKFIMESLDRMERAESEDGRKAELAKIREMTAPQEVTVTGIFESGNGDFDSNIIFVHLKAAQLLFNIPPEDCHGIAVRTMDGFEANEYQEKFRSVLPAQYRVMTWGQIHKVIFDVVAAERQGMYLILFMIVIVSGFSIMNTMITVAHQKRAEIGLIKALGALEGQVAWIFLAQGMMVGAFGVIVGLGFAELTLFFRNDIAGWLGQHFGVGFFTNETFMVDGGLPAKRTLRDFVIISAGAFAACTVASTIPAIIAASLQPAKALRSE